MQLNFHAIKKENRWWKIQLNSSLSHRTSARSGEYFTKHHSSKITKPQNNWRHLTNKTTFHCSQTGDEGKEDDSDNGDNKSVEEYDDDDDEGQQWKKKKT